ncbi:MAG: response regulator, partial [Bacteroidota bacterium]|nr:response regulator [Bacteroidota bacterium]
LKQQLLDLNEAFVEMSRQKHLAFDFQVLSSADFTFSFDVEKMERIYYNLLSNAFKYTPEKGHISVSLNKIEKEIQTFAEISISNSGEGLSPEDIHHIFERFYQVDSRMAGSGIGLALVKALVELHEGDIQVISQSGKTTFIVRIPFKQAQTEVEKDSEKTGIITSLDGTVDNYRETVFEVTEAQDLPIVLVVDDNPDICVYIKTILQNQYTVYEAKDGEEGLRKAIKYVPDIIVSDVMMPKVDGIALCQRLKQELSTSHIPIILLTACSLVEQRISGFENGADDYISKPFNATLLQVRIRKLIENRQQLKKIYGEQLFSEDAKGRLNEQDKKSFLDKFRQIIEKDISNSELCMDDLGKSIGLSRVQLYRKIKSMTDYSPNELLKIIRLKKAYQLLSTTEKTISEVTYDTGFTSPSYFTKCFREYYKESPSDYLKRVRK